ncbi:DUF881 domain-containing protein [Kitasatospora sp. NPDC056531]|uniref:DUF881 domain-containing protein n=1 Tax=Kitasatospora sp. NPDC056531 TaxID=3345856 RepID=UPI0036A8A03D
MSSVPEPGREAAAEEKAAGKAVEEPGSEASESETAEETAPVDPADSGAEPGAAEAESESAEPEKSDAEAELEGTAAESEPVVSLTKAAEPESAAGKSRTEPERDPEPEPKDEAGPEPTESEPTEPAKAAEAEQPSAGDRNAGRRRLKAALWPPRLSRGQLVVALLLFSLGLGLAIQVRSTNDHHNQLRGARQEDLVRILDELDSRQQRLQQEKAELEQSLAKLENSSNQAKEAQEQTRKKMTELGVLAGTVKATGPGIVLTVDDPQGQVKADMLLDTLQELRAAGAEAIQINDVRVVVNTYFTDLSGGGVQIDGKKVAPPYRFTVVGNPQDLTPALNIPGGVVRTLESHQARATITQQQKVVVDALVDLKTPQYAKPASK